MRTDKHSRDPLTGAYSRTALAVQFPSLVAEARHSAQSLALLIIDLDYFKSINDAFGHRRGDQVLREFVQRMRSLDGMTDLIFRYGGDEFVVLLPQTDRIQAHAWAERLLNTIRGVPFGEDAPLTISLTIGFAMLPDDATATETLFEYADRRLLAAKRAGRDRIGSDDTLPTLSPPFSTSTRLIEREAAFITIHQFLDELPTNLRGQLTISGPSGIGRSTVVDEAAQHARVRGYFVLNLYSSPGLRRRLYGALLDSQQEWPELPNPLAGADMWIKAIHSLVTAQNRLGLIITVDDAPELDHATLDLLRELLRSPDALVVGIITSRRDSAWLRPSSLKTRFGLNIDLAPLSIAGLGVWLRSVLQWESPVSFHEWLYQQTSGIPGLLQMSLSEMVAQGILTATATGWLLRPDFAATTLTARLLQLSGPRPHNLPSSTTQFVGREAEIHFVKQQLGIRRLVTLTGPGGIGKTRLALQVASELVDEYMHGVWFVQLANVTSIEQMLVTIATVLELPLVAQSPAKAQLSAGLRDRDLLLIVDNIEHLLDGATLLTDITAQAPNVRLLITSRERLWLPHEASLELQGLPVPTHASAVDLEHASAIRLFIHSARNHGQSFTSTDDDLPAIWQICQLVEGMPLGIELAAAWTALFSCHEIAEQLAYNHDLLTTVPGREQPGGNLRAVFDYFWRQLSPDEQRVVRRLGVFRGGFERDAARTIAGASPFLLAALVDKAFLSRTGMGRYSLHRLLQQYAGGHLAQWPEDHAAVQYEHAVYYLALAERANRELVTEAQIPWLDRLDAEHENLRTVLAWARDTARDSLGLHLAGLLGHFWRVRGHCTEGRDWLQQLLVHDSTLSPDYLVALRWAGILAQEQGDLSAAWTLLNRYLTLARMRTDSAAIADSLGYLGWIASVQGRYDQAQEYLSEGLELARQGKDKETLLHILNNLGEVAFRQGFIDQSRAYYTESLTIARLLGDRREISESLLGLGNTFTSQNDYAEAIEIYSECLMHARAIEDRRRIGESLGNLGMIAQRQGAYEHARHCLLECLAAFEAIGDQLDIAISYAALGSVARELHEGQAAQQYFQAALTRATRIGAIPIALEAIAGIATLLIRDSQIELGAMWLCMVQSHPASSTELSDEVSAHLTTVYNQLSPERMMALRDQGRRSDIDTVINEALLLAPGLHAAIEQHQ